ncbi:MAG: hypothetical protein ABSC34_08790 [Acidimicrobiales bacterium]
MTEADMTRDDAEATKRVDTGDGAPVRPRRWAVWALAIAIAVVGCLWYGFSRHTGPTVRATVTDCSRALEESTTAQSTANLKPGIVGLGSVAAIATFTTPSGLRWCFDGMGLATGPISRAQMRSSLSAPVAVVDGSLKGNVLMLVHLARRTTSVVVTTATSRSNVLASDDGFEVLRVSMAQWPHWRTNWTRGGVSLGRIIGFDNEGRVTSSVAFMWCPGSINASPTTGCG